MTRIAYLTKICSQVYGVKKNYYTFIATVFNVLTGIYTPRIKTTTKRKNEISGSKKLGITDTRVTNVMKWGKSLSSASAIYSYTYKTCANGFRPHMFFFDRHSGEDVWVTFVCIRWNINTSSKINLVIYFIMFIYHSLMESQGFFASFFLWYYEKQHLRAITLRCWICQN